MNDSIEIERRLATALSRIEAGQAQMQGQTAADNQDEMIANLRQQLEEKAQELEGAKAQNAEGAVQQNAAQGLLQDTVKKLETLTGQLQASNAALRGSNDALRKAYADQSGNGDVLNAAQEAELQALRAERTAEQDYVDTLLMALQAQGGD